MGQEGGCEREGVRGREHSGSVLHACWLGLAAVLCCACWLCLAVLALSHLANMPKVAMPR